MSELTDTLSDAWRPAAGAGFLTAPQGTGQVWEPWREHEPGTQVPAPRDKDQDLREGQDCRVVTAGRRDSDRHHRALGERSPGRAWENQDPKCPRRAGYGWKKGVSLRPCFPRMGQSSLSAVRSDGDLFKVPS